MITTPINTEDIDLALFPSDFSPVMRFPVLLDGMPDVNTKLRAVTRGSTRRLENANDEYLASGQVDPPRGERNPLAMASSANPAS